jgi:hypothetical protein
MNRVNRAAARAALSIVLAATMELVGYFGRYGGHGVGEFSHIHSIATEAAGAGPAWLRRML